MNNYARSVFVAVGVLLALGLQAHSQTPSPGTPGAVAATCKDGTAFSGNSKKGACSGHGGVKTWGTNAAAATPAAGANTAPSPTKSATVATAKPGGGVGQVWVNTDSKVYHCSGTRWYGKTKQGEYMSEQAAKTSGFRPADNKTCSG
ncbi:MAG: hypothetical protein WA864_27965 [Acetobacteraceae bacterium]|jgi:hypothetical protein